MEISVWPSELTNLFCLFSEVVRNRWGGPSLMDPVCRLIAVDDDDITIEGYVSRSEPAVPVYNEVWFEEVDEDYVYLSLDRFAMEETSTAPRRYLHDTRWVRLERGWYQNYIVGFGSDWAEPAGTDVFNEQLWISYASALVYLFDFFFSLNVHPLADALDCTRLSTARGYDRRLWERGTLKDRFKGRFQRDW